MKYENNRGGFTLIELVIVIVILGILSALAAPKFMDLQRDARIAAVHGLAGAIKSGVSMVYDKSIILGREKKADSCIWAYSDGLEDDCDINSVQAINNDDAIFLSYGWPAATATGLTRTLSEIPEKFITDRTDYVADWVYAENPVALGEVRKISIWPAKAVKVTPDASAGCGIIYTEASDDNNPKLEIVNKDC